jgi:MFS family permease
MGGTVTALSATLAALAPAGRQGTVYGVESTVTSVANAVGPMVSAALAVAGGLRMPFLGSAALFALAGMAASRLLRADPPRHSPVHENGV